MASFPGAEAVEVSQAGLRKSRHIKQTVGVASVLGVVFLWVSSSFLTSVRNNTKVIENSKRI